MIDLGRWMYISLIPSILFVPIIFMYGRCSLGGPFGSYGKEQLMMPVAPMFLVKMHFHLWKEYRWSKGFRLDPPLARTLLIYYVAHVALQLVVVDSDDPFTPPYSILTLCLGCSGRISKVLWGVISLFVFGFALISILCLRSHPVVHLDDGVCTWDEVDHESLCFQTDSSYKNQFFQIVQRWMHNSLYPAIWVIPLWINFGRLMMGGVFGSEGVFQARYSPLFLFFHLYLWRNLSKNKHLLSRPQVLALMTYYVTHVLHQLLFVDYFLGGAHSVASNYFGLSMSASKQLDTITCCGLVLLVFFLLFLVEHDGSTRRGDASSQLQGEEGEHINLQHGAYSGESTT